EDQKFRAEYVIQKNRYFIQHSDYDAVASSTRKPIPAPTPDPNKKESSDASEADRERTFDVDNIKGMSSSAWAEGVEGDGIGESCISDVQLRIPLAQKPKIQGAR